ncbi:MAG: hypothetical protein B6D35_08500 [Candidatus Brocadia sp. UTAMX2]|jgi:hypothetical protein|nr:MAG: hypothetical protein B6D35_08500 [Candidatus Brocadia sp. UTAMX2]
MQRTIFAPAADADAAAADLCWFNRPRLNQNGWHFSRLVPVQNIPYRAKRLIQTARLNQLVFYNACVFL